MRKIISSAGKSGRPSGLIVFANIWLAAVLFTFLLLRVFESRAAAHLLHDFPLR